MKVLKNFLKLFLLGGRCYCAIEVLCRGYTHWTMGVAGGLCFSILYKVYIKLKYVSLIKKCIIGSLIITTVEFISGCIINLWLKIGVWDYSNVPMNLMGQICLLYSILWGFLCVPIHLLVIGIEKFKNKKIKRID